LVSLDEHSADHLDTSSSQHVGLGVKASFCAGSVSKPGGVA
jgi:hypothetical protein